MRLRVTLRARDALHLQPERDVVDHALPGKQRVLLEHEAAVGMRPVDDDAVHAHRAACRREVARERAQQRRLAAARRPQQADELARRDAEAHVVQRLEARGAIAHFHVHVLDVDAARAHRVAPVGAHGIARCAATRISALQPMPSSPITSMPTVMPP